MVPVLTALWGCHPNGWQPLCISAASEGMIGSQANDHAVSP